jgi:hypothetical protein
MPGFPSWYKCNQCQIEYWAKDGKTLMRWHQVFLGEKQYRIEIFCTTSSLAIRYLVDTVFLTVLTIDYLQDHITPDNIKDKLRFYLTFQ